MIDITEDTTLEQLVLVLKEFAGEVIKHSARDMCCLIRTKDLSMPQVSALMYLHRHRMASISELREYLNLSLAATSHLVDRLVAPGYVTRTEDPNDRRLKQVMLTEAGAALIDEVKQTRVEEIARRLGQMPVPLRRALTETMEEALGYLRSAEPRDD